MERQTATGLDSVRRHHDVENVATEDDVAILIVGPTGVGKSTFVRNIFEAPGSFPDPNDSDAFRPCVDRLVQYRVQVSNVTDRHVVLVDTPSFDRGSVEDAFEILRQISVWLASLHAAGLRVGGIVFMYAIYPNKLTRTDIASFRVFRELCGTRHFLRIIGVTTKWDSCPSNLGQAREQGIWKEFWKDVSFRNETITVYRLHDTIESALSFFGSIVRRCELVGIDLPPLTIQREIVGEGKTFENTAAAKLLRSMLINEEKDRRRSSNSFSRIVLRFRRATVSIISVTEPDPSTKAAFEPDPGDRQRRCPRCRFPIEELPAPDLRLSRASSYYTALMTPVKDSPVSDWSFSPVSNYLPPFNDSTPTTLTTPILYEGPDLPEIVRVDPRSSSSFSSSSSTLPPHRPPSRASSSATLDGASPSPPPSARSDAEHGNYEYQQHFMPNANHFSVGEMYVQGNQTQVRDHGTLNITNNITNVTNNITNNNITNNITNNYNITNNHNINIHCSCQGRSCRPQRQFTV